MMDDMGFREAIEAYGSGFSVTRLTPEERIEKICQKRFLESFVLASHGPCMRINGLNRLDDDMSRGKRLLKLVAQENRERYNAMLVESYDTYLAKIENIIYPKRGIPKEMEPAEILEHAIDFGFRRALRMASDVSYQRGMDEFDTRAAVAYKMLKNIDPNEREKYEALVNSRYDEFNIKIQELGRAGEPAAIEEDQYNYGFARYDGIGQMALAVELKKIT